MKYHLITLGCQMNKSDSERVRTVLDAMGYVWTEDEATADLLGVLACSVRQKAIDRVYTRIYHWNQAKDSRNLLTFVTGCILPDDKVKFLKLFDFVFTMNELPQFPEMVQQYGIVSPLSGDGGGAFSDPLDLHDNRPATVAGDPESDRAVMDALWTISATPASHISAFVPIQNGCNKFCTYCAVPYTRGREVSRKSQEILSEVEQLIADGYRSITLLGQNVNSYGLDRKGAEMRFAELLAAIGQMGKGRDTPLWIYYTSPHPRDMTRDVLEVMASYDCIGKQIHLPLQSGDDQVLRKMNRQHSLKAYSEIVAMIRDLMPHATLFTDIIVGFTGETDAQFENTLTAIEAFRFNMIFVAKYSPRPGAASSRWQDDVPNAVKGERLQRVNDLATEHTLAWNQDYLGKKLPVLITGLDRKQENLAGLTEGRINVRIPGTDITQIGKVVDITVTRALPFCIGGEFL